MPDEDRYVETWRAFETLLADGRARAIGVSNLDLGQLERVLERTGLVPAVNQIEVHPHLQEPELTAYHRAHRIVTEAWSPIARGEVLDDRVIGRIAGELGRTPAQAVLRWHVQLGIVAIPRSVNPGRIAENIAITDFELADEQMAEIAGIDRGTGNAQSRANRARLPPWRP
jgi:diketogulonate reductase-like aldo/keto reductase